MSRPPAAPPRILIVEDEGIVAMELRDLLEGSGFAVVGVAVRGEDAVRAAEAAAPDLVLMDVTLRDGMSGIEAARRILDRRRVPILFLTAAADPSSIADIRTRTDCGFVAKPFEERDFLRHVASLLEAGRSRGAPAKP